MKKVAIHQPNFFPWLGYFIKMHAADVFVYLDDVEFSKQSLTRRTRIRNSRGISEYFRIDVLSHSDYVRINELQLRDPDRWSTISKTLLRDRYHGAPHYDFAYAFLAPLLEKSTAYSSFSTYSIYILESIRTLLEIDTCTTLSSTLDIASRKTDRNIELVQHHGGTHYLSGTGAKKYQTVEEFNTHGIVLDYVESYSYLTSIEAQYPQLRITYSIIDALFYLDIESIKTIVKGYLEKKT